MNTPLHIIILTAKGMKMHKIFAQKEGHTKMEETNLRCEKKLSTDSVLPVYGVWQH